jgi:hypothetical protein
LRVPRILRAARTADLPSHARQRTNDDDFLDSQHAQSSGLAPRPSPALRAVEGGYFGNSTVNTDPTPGVLATLTVPPCASTTCLTTNNPSPRPP